MYFIYKKRIFSARFKFFTSSIGCAITQAVSRLPFTSEMHFLTTGHYVGFMADKVALGEVILRVHPFSMSVVIPSMLYSLISFDRHPS
jgi:hypothetical protein